MSRQLLRLFWEPWSLRVWFLLWLLLPGGLVFLWWVLGFPLGG